MSSTHEVHAASRCVDGILDNMCHTLTGSNPWLAVDLPDTGRAAGSTVQRVVLYNRVDGGADTMSELSPLQLWVGATAGDYQSPTSTPCLNGTELNWTTPVGPGPFSFDCAQARAYYNEARGILCKHGADSPEVACRLGSPRLHENAFPRY